MLPKEFTDLFDGFIRVYDAEHSMPIELRNAHNRAAASVQSSGQGYHISRLVPYLAKNLLECIEKRGQFILEKFKVIWTSTQIELYPDLSVDLKSQIAGYLNPSRQAAESYLEHMRISGNVPSGYTVETKRAFDNILPRIYAEVDLLCASGFTKAKIHNSTAKAPNQVFNIGTVNGGVGDIQNSPITVNPGEKSSMLGDEHGKQSAKLAPHSVISKTYSEPQKSKNSKCVFVVHGRNMALRDSMFSFLRAIGLQPLEWSQAVTATGEGSPYIGQVLDTAFSMAQAIVVLMTPDDEARLREEFQTETDDHYEKELTAQARPNVLFEAGMAMGRDAKRTVLVQVGQLRPFSDISGRHVLRLKNTSPSRQELADRLRTAGCEVNLSGTDWHMVGSFDFIAKQLDHPTKELQQKMEEEVEKPAILVETVLVNVDVVDPSSLNSPTMFIHTKTVKKNMFAVKIRNQSSFPVNIDAVGFTIKDKLVRAMFWIPTSNKSTLPKRLESRSSILMQFGHVETTGPNDIGEIDGVYVETGCGHTITKKDDLFQKWSETADLKPIH